MSELFIRRPSGDSEWTEDASALCNSFATAVRAALKDAEEYGPVDLRDFQTIAKSAVDDVIMHEMICRRLSPVPKTPIPPPNEHPQELDFEDLDETW